MFSCFTVIKIHYRLLHAELVWHDHVWAYNLHVMLILDTTVESAVCGLF